MIGGTALRDGPGCLCTGFEALLATEEPGGSLDTSPWVLLVVVDAVSLLVGDFLDSADIVAEVASEARRCAMLPGTADRFGTVDDFTSLKACDVKEPSAASLRGRSGPFFDAAILLVAFRG